MERRRYPKGRFVGVADSGAADFQMTPRGGVYSNPSKIIRTAKSKNYENEKFLKTPGVTVFTGNDS